MTVEETIHNVRSIECEGPSKYGDFECDVHADNKDKHGGFPKIDVVSDQVEKIQKAEGKHVKISTEPGTRCDIDELYPSDRANRKRPFLHCFSDNYDRYFDHLHNN